MDALERTLQPTRRTLGDVDPAQPLDMTHPLLDGVQGFWLPLPHLTGGSKLYDLSAYGRHGSFKNGLTGSDWTHSSVPYPVIDFEIPDTRHIDVPSSAIMGREKFSVGAWCKTPDVSEDQRFISAWDFSLGQRWEMYINAGGSGPSWATGIAVSGTFSSAGTDSNNANADTWYWVSTTLDGDTLYIYVDGELQDSVGYSGEIEDTTYFRIGQNGNLNSSNNNLEGKITAPIITHDLSASEQAALYDQARRGFPDLLRRRDSVSLLGGGGGPTADTVSLGTGTALAEGFDPVLTATANTIAVGTGQAAAQGFSATVTATQNTVSLGTAQATAQGFESTITIDPNTVGATTGQAAAQGFDPTISEGAVGDTITANLGTAQAQGFAPSITSNPATVTLGLGQATASGFDPGVVPDPSQINTGQGQAAATGFDPTITTNARTVAPQLGLAQAQGFEPAVVDGTVGVATTMEIEARPLYEIDVETKPLYRIRLFVKEQLP